MLQSLAPTVLDEYVNRIMPAALVPRPWDFDLPPGTPSLIPLHETGPLEQLPQPKKAEDSSGRPSGELPPVSFQTTSVPTGTRQFNS